MRGYFATMVNATRGHRLDFVDAAMLVAGCAAPIAAWLLPDLRSNAIVLLWPASAICTVFGLTFWRLLRYANQLETRPRRDTSFVAAAQYVVTKKWQATDAAMLPAANSGESDRDWKIRVSTLPQYDDATEALRFLLQAAVDGSLTIWARPKARSCLQMNLSVDRDVLLKPLDPTHWDTHEIDIHCFTSAPDQIYTVRRGEMWMDDQSVCSLMVSKRQVELLCRQHAVAA